MKSIFPFVLGILKEHTNFPSKPLKNLVNIISLPLFFKTVILLFSAALLTLSHTHWRTLNPPPPKKNKKNWILNQQPQLHFPNEIFSILISLLNFKFLKLGFMIKKYRNMIEGWGENRFWSIWGWDSRPGSMPGLTDNYSSLKPIQILSCPNCKSGQLIFRTTSFLKTFCSDL